MKTQIDKLRAFVNKETWNIDLDPKTLLNEIDAIKMDRDRQTLRRANDLHDVGVAYTKSLEEAFSREDDLKKALYQCEYLAAGGETQEIIRLVRSKIGENYPDEDL